MKFSTLTQALILTLGVSAFSASAADSNQWKDSAQDGWIDGKAEATLLFNGNLNSFDINTDVKQGVVYLTGNVDSDVDKRLAGELVRNIDGVKKVDNQLTVMDEKQQSSDLKQDLVDSKIATVVKTSLLLEPDVNGSDINVDVEQGVVTLKGEVESDAMRQLALLLAKHTDDVKKVDDQLNVVTQ
ncbi:MULTISPECIES: BON domain-containing protein [unclassified Vibrio]|uniref:BON domain-containing protein n=1 Tax=unclassified Vibrio TaxID=2614977 RepID=UPI0013619CEA|nr:MULTISPECIES: BON domain-containing protein [unclassified Vibrio]NAW59025.1 BON domain-containing protein [Vibrio sp. V36_P2S2PM302]NAX20274.1 BON domain-containing protein [Vibrio sp. V39_P1S14PM300]NAX25718.1 BON domain-containing protein [Vibrio sp. V38_P2S17PM301]NAX30109.1 BON domain-containing protein [Vibrio sp. V37_P2S8PM304]